MLKKLLQIAGFKISKDYSLHKNTQLYRPHYSPWESFDFDTYYKIAEPRTLVSRDRCYVLDRLLRQTIKIKGEIFECGVYKGGTAKMIPAILNEYQTSKSFYLFDTFEGMPETDAMKDLHKKGDFSDTTLESVRKFLSYDERCIFKKGFIPETFEGLSHLEISFCHIDVDIYKSIIDCLNFVWPRLSMGGIIVFDDYGFSTCPGALEAVNEFFKSKSEIPLCLHTGQAIAIKNCCTPN